MGDFATLSGGTKKSNGNPTDELKWKFTVFSSTRHNSRILTEVTREGKN